MLIPGEPAADIGADHALLSIYLIDQQITSQVIATELGEGPYRRLYKAVQDIGYTEWIEVRRGNGIQPLLAGEVGNVIIAGIGGDTIVEILSCDWEKSASMSRYILQPMSRPAVLRRALASQGWALLDEKLVRENHHFYAILVASPEDKPYWLSPLESDIGPILLRQPGKLQQAYRQYFYNRYRRVRDSLLHSNKDESRRLLLEIENKLNELEGYM